MVNVRESKSVILRGRLDTIIGNGSDMAGTVIHRLQNEAIVDRVVKTNTLRAAIVGGPGHHELRVHGGEGHVRMSRVHRSAFGQLGDRLKLPTKWLREELSSGESWRVDRAADIVNSQFVQSDPEDRLLLRSVDADKASPDIRGVLSTSYRRLDSAMMVNAFAEACQAIGAVPYRAQLTDLRWRISALVPRVFEFHTTAHGWDAVVGCVHLGNSDFGHGKNSLSFELMRVVCVNGMIGTSVLSTTHLGRRLTDDVQLSQRTYRLDSETQASSIRDLVGGVLTEEYLREKLEGVTKAAEEPVDLGSSLKTYVKAKRLTLEEAEAVQETFDRRDESQIPQGPPTRYSLGQALSWVSQARTDDRREELEVMAGELVGVA